MIEHLTLLETSPTLSGPGPTGEDENFNEVVDSSKLDSFLSFEPVPATFYEVLNLILELGHNLGLQL